MQLQRTPMPSDDARGKRAWRGLRVVRTHGADGRLSPEFLTNINVGLAERQRRERAKRGSALINVATGLLFALAAGLFAVSINAQFTVIFAAKHAHIVSWIEAVGLDAGMVIFTLLALGLARAGQPARIERLCIVACAIGSAAMNYAPADPSDPRSVLVYVMPPIFLAIVVDRTVAVVRRHYLGEPDTSAWSQVGEAVRGIARFAGRVALYGLRFALAPLATATGLRRVILAATPLPEAAPEPLKVRAINPPKRPKITQSKPPKALPPGREGSKTAAFIALVIERHGPLSDFPLEQVSRTCAELAPEVGLDPGSARTALRKQVLAAQNGSAS
jgi:hypothetical protein